MLCLPFRCTSLEQHVEEVQSQQHEQPVLPSPEQEEQHAAAISHLQEQILRLQQESDSYRYVC